MGGFSIWHWVVVLVVVVLVFGTKKLRNVGQDLGEAVKGFKKGVADANKDDAPPAQLRDGSADAQADAAKAERDRQGPVA